jgi:hypothetical protein
MEEQGRIDEALDYCRRSWAAVPDATRNPDTAAALERLSR